MNLIKRLYDAVIVDDYIEPLTPQYLSAILAHSKRKRKQSKSKLQLQPESYLTSPESSVHSLEQLPDNTSDDLHAIFKTIPHDYQLQHLNHLHRHLVDKLNKIKTIIVTKSPKYIESIDQCLLKSEEVTQESEITRPKVVALKQSLRRLEMSRSKSQKIVSLRIKYNNIKLLNNYLQKLPNPNIMKLSDLKRISLQQWLKQLKCYEDIEKFIQLRSEQAHSEVIQTLEQLIERFDQKKYKEITFKYLQLQIDTQLDALLQSVLVKQIRRFDLNYTQLASHFVNIMKNFLQICLFHKNNPSFIDLKDKILLLRSKVWTIMQQHITEVIRQTIGLSAVQLFELSCQMNRLVQIGEGFSSHHVGIIRQELNSKQTVMYNSSFNKYLLSLNESMNIQESSQWSRLPVDNLYRHSSLQNVICSIVNRSENSTYKKLVQNDFYYLGTTRKQNQMPNMDETWDIAQYKVDTSIPQSYKLRKIYASIYQYSIDKDVVISQSVLPILKFYEEMSEYLFSLRLVTEKILAVMFFLTDFYLYFVFTTFVPGDAKRLIFMKPSGVKETYEKAKINNKYPNVVKFINKFQEEYHKNGFQKITRIQQSKLQQKMVRARVVALQSFEFITKYLIFCLNNLRKVVPRMNVLWKRVQERFNSYPSILKQLSQLLYSECIYKLTNIESLLSPMWKMPWDDHSETTYTLHQTRVTLQLYMKDFLQKLRANSKGQIPSNTIEYIYILFCKYISRYLQNKIVRLQKVSTSGKQSFIDMLKSLQKQMATPVQYDFTQEISKLIRVSSSSDWEEVQEFIRESINKCNLSFTGLVALASHCKASEQLQKNKRQQRGKIVQEYINKAYG